MATSPKQPGSRGAGDGSTEDLRSFLLSLFGPGSESESRHTFVDDTIAFVTRSYASPAVGDRLGRFTLTEWLGKGSYGHVFAADHETQGRVAVKVVAVDDADRVRMLRKEADLLPRVRHPNVVDLVEQGADDDWSWIAMRLVEGPTLEELLAGEAGGRPDVRTCVTWLRDLARAIACMHAEGLLHRDIKPANIVVDRGRKPVLIDFGLAIEATDGSVRSWLAGTVPYMSPEQTHAGFSALDERSDIFSLAITMLEALTGWRRRFAEGQSSRLLTVAFDEVRPPSRLDRRVPRSLDPIFRRALSLHPRDRYASAEQLAEDLDLWLYDRPLRHATEERAVRTWRFARHHPATAALIAGLAVWLPVSLGSSIGDADRELEVGLVRVRAALDGVDADPEAALDLARPLKDAHPDDQQVDSDYRRALERVAPARSQRLLEALTFFPSWDYARSPFRSIVEEAELDFAHVQTPDLLFQIALGRVMAYRLGDALEQLERHPELLHGNLLLQELRALLLLELEIDELAAYRVARSQLGEADNGDHLARCLRCYRVVLEAKKLGDLAPKGALERAVADLSSILELQPRLRLARTVRVFARYHSRDARGALEDLEVLGLRACEFDDLEFHAFLTWQAKVTAAVVDDATVGPPARNWDRIMRWLDEACRVDPQFVVWFVDHVRLPGEDKLPEHPDNVELVRRLFTHDWPNEPAFNAMAWFRLHQAVAQLNAAGDDAGIRQLLRTVTESGLEPNEEVGRSYLTHVQVMVAFGSLPNDQAGMRSPGEPGEVEWLRLVVGWRLDAGEEWDARVAHALALARLALITEDADEARCLRESARDLLARAVADEEVERARAAVRDQGHDEERLEQRLAMIDSMRTQCEAVREDL